MVPGCSCLVLIVRLHLVLTHRILILQNELYTQAGKEDFELGMEKCGKRDQAFTSLSSFSKMKDFKVGKKDRHTNTQL